MLASGLPQQGRIFPTGANPLGACCRGFQITSGCQPYPEKAYNPTDNYGRMPPLRTGILVTLSFNFHPLGSLALTRKGLPEGINRSQLLFQSPFSLVLPDGFPTFEASFLYPDYHVLNPKSKGTSLKFSFRAGLQQTSKTIPRNSMLCWVILSISLDSFLILDLSLPRSLIHLILIPFYTKEYKVLYFKQFLIFNLLKQASFRWFRIVFHRLFLFTPSVRTRFLLLSFAIHGVSPWKL